MTSRTLPEGDMTLHKKSDDDYGSNQCMTSSTGTSMMLTGHVYGGVQPYDLSIGHRFNHNHGLASQWSMSPWRPLLKLIKLCYSLMLSNPCNSFEDRASVLNLRVPDLQMSGSEFIYR